MKRIETERLILRPFTLDDIDPSYEMNLDPDVSKHTGDGGVVSKEELSRRIREDVLGDYKKHGYGRFAVEMKEGPRFIGFAGLKYIPEYNEVDLGYRLMKKYWGIGLATEASKACLNFGFTQLGLESIAAYALEENPASVNVLNKLGFRFQNRIKEDNMEFNRYLLSKTEYEKNINVI